MFDPDAGTQEERDQIERLRQQFLINKKKLDIHCCGDVLMRTKLIKESGIDLLSEPPMRVGQEEDVSYEAVTTTVRKAIRLNRAIQAWDGHWPAEIAGPHFFTPPLIMALYISGTLDTILTKEHKKEMIRYMYIHQNEDGGWGFYISGKSTMMGSALNYVALRLLGEPSPLDIDEDSALARGRKWILDNGGATSIPSWGKVYLAVVGVYKWEGNNPLPPEFWLFPSFLPYHPAKKWSYCRTAYMPMSYLYGKSYHGLMAQLLILLIGTNNDVHNCCKIYTTLDHTIIQNLLWDGLHHFTEPIVRKWPFNKLREKGLQRVLELMHYGAEESRYMAQGCALQIMCFYADDPNGIHFKRHLARIPDYLWIAEDGMKMQSFGSQLWDCTLITQSIMASNMVDEYGDSLKKAHFFLKESQAKNLKGDFTKMCRQFTKGAWTFSDQDHGWVVSDCTAEALKCLLALSQMAQEIAGEKAEVERLYDAVNVLLYLQVHIYSLDGGFAIWEPPVPQPYLQMLNPSEIFADIVVEKEHVECTGCIIQALTAFKKMHPGHREKEIEIAIEKGIGFLEKKQQDDGSCEIVRKAVNFFLSTQNSEGGWGESFESCPKEKFIPLEGNRTNLVQTSWAMLGLLYGGQV
ncbi:hypothetical protein E3N88_02156 [Mikania micrantha]|uniref:Terpene cyclase/mutase family member n=1 Tax=Mikania micrantha TaxID=192012 RepID=A0A5N6Q5P4_9ASTR|nr:hypothetical protein E3N88_02156 [Mikania micrantha]